jgi:hypothetical protein
VPQFAFAGGQALANLAQRLGRGQLAKHHGHKLAPTGKPSGVSLGMERLDGLLELRSRKQLEQLSENAAYSIHGGTLLRLRWFWKLHLTLTGGSACFLES